MRFTFTEDQRLFQSTVRDLLEKECPVEHVRASWESPTGRSPDLWRRLADLGVVGALVPEDHGGLGLDEVDLVLVLEEAGRVALPEPLADTAAVGAPLLVDVDSLDHLPGVAAGDTVLAVGLEGPPYVADAHIADVLLLQQGDAIHAVARDDATLAPVPTLDGARRLFRVSWRPTQATKLVEGVAGRAAVVDAFDRSALAAAAQLLGLADRMIEMAAGYAREREQFGKPIGSFQAVKHLLADSLLALEFARPLTYRAAWSVAHRTDERSRDVSMAKSYASDAVAVAARAALQVHGAIGYTWEHDLHLWMKRGWALAAAWGDAAWHRRRVADTLLGPAT